MSNVLSLDIATSSGVAILIDNTITVYNLKCETEKIPFFVSSFKDIIDDLDEILVEEWTHFNDIRNPKTTRDLLYRIGFVKNRFLEMSFPVHMPHVKTVRSKLGIKGKNSDAKKKVNQQLRELTGLVLTTDISDAVAQLMAFLGKDSLEAIKEYEFVKLKTVKI